MENLSNATEKMDQNVDFSSAREAITRYKSMFQICGTNRELISCIIAELDRRISAQINLILHNESFQTLEGTWRGLYYLVFSSVPASDIKIRVLNLSLRDMARCLKKYPGPTWDQSRLFKLIYEFEFGTAGGEPFGCLIGDYYFDESPFCIEVLKGISRIVSAAHVPFITGALPSIMNMDSWKELANPRNNVQLFNSPEYVSWRSFRDNPDSRYIALTLPRILARVPYGSRLLPVNGLDFEEEIGAGIHRNYCWTNAAFFMGINVILAFAKYGWCVRISGYDNGIGTGLYPMGISAVCDEDIPVPLLETAVTDQHELDLSKNGFLVLSILKNTSYPVFQSGQTVYRAKTYSIAAATKNEDLSSKLPCIFVVSRFAHYIKCILRDKIGGFHGVSEIEQWLNNWLSGYVAGDPDASDEIKAKYPLAEARVHVVPRKGNPGQYDAEIYLRPHYQLDGLTASVKLTAKIPEGEKI